MNGSKRSFGGGGGRGKTGAQGAQQGKDGQRRPMFRRRKVCKFCADKIDDINYKDTKLLMPFVPERAKILPRRISGTCAMHERKIVETREADEKPQADALAARLAAVDIRIARRVGDTEQLYGSVTAADITEYLKAKGFDVDRRKLILPEAIKSIGEHDVPLK